MRDADSEPSVEMTVTEYEYELLSAYREIRDQEVAAMIGELVHVLSISHMAQVIPITRKAIDLTVAGGRDVYAAGKEPARATLGLVDA